MLLSDITEAIVDCEHKTAPEGDGYAYSVGTKAMKGGRLVMTATKPVSAETYAGWTRRMRPKTGDLILAREAPVGDVVRVPEQPLVCLGQRTVLIRPDASKVHPRFLHYWLLGPDAQGVMRAQTGGATVGHLNVEDIRKLNVEPMPTDARHQANAAEILGAIDDLIENSRRRAEVLEDIARTVFREWFLKFRYPGHADVPLVDSALGPVPERWQILPASRAIIINPRIKLDKTVGHPFIAMGDLDEKSMGCRPSEVRSSGSGAKFERGDTLFARITPCLQNGKTGLVQTLAEGEVGLGSTEFIVLRGQLVGSAYTYCLAREDSFRGHAIASMSGASGRQRVRNECFDTYLIALPPQDLADKFESMLEPLFAEIAVLLNEVERLQALRDLLLPKLVTGQIDMSMLSPNELLGELAA
ncbi:Putative specificity protein s (plasmid) [Sinomonas atrocyanea]|uniref:Putative specificity protein s n=1 Tax=Sinomonas atrocyanea TaxID=37927 RepID=A0A127A721_9MICC|nr:restriction endonuclease subunit S [Sinomonas atrocyanea]AMM34751.1 Putative specificity protein s [Sinomonas atrocyanea]GEB66249.1 restriction endonuclease [Sinomonas atrocyanea]GGG80167.1 restriction endonuclease [Sinomonas atrocyanea]